MSVAANIQNVMFSRRFAVKTNQGIGWSEYQGDAWVQPQLNGGGVIVYDNNGNRRLVIDDQNENMPGLFEIGTYDQVTFSSAPFVDKENYSGGDVSIACVKYFPELSADAKRQNDLLEHLESHVFTRPQLVRNKGRSGYDENGFQEGMELSVDMFVDGESRIQAGTATNIPNDGDIVFSGAKIEGHRIMPRVSTTNSEFKVTALNHYMLSKPRPNHLTLTDYPDMNAQVALSSNLAMWITRGKIGYDKIAKNQVLLNSGDGSSKAASLDGNPFGAVVLTKAVDVGVADAAGELWTIIVCASSGCFPQGMTPTQYSDAWNGAWVAYCSFDNTQDVILPAGTYYDLRIAKQESSGYIKAYYNALRYTNGDAFLPI